MLNFEKSEKYELVKPKQNKTAIERMGQAFSNRKNDNLTES